MTRALTKQLAQAILIILAGGAILTTINIKLMPSHKPYYSVIATQRVEKLAAQPDNNTPNDTNSRATPK